jgi:hypothetical protein
MKRPIPSLLIAVAACGWHLGAAAQQALLQTPLRDPWVPPHAGKPVPRAATQNAELRAQAEQKLRAAFEAADVERAGSVTQAQAQAAGLGIVANNFATIDTRRAGRVTFEDFKRFLRTRGADL